MSLKPVKCWFLELCSDTEATCAAELTCYTNQCVQTACVWFALNGKVNSSSEARLNGRIIGCPLSFLPGCGLVGRLAALWVRHKRDSHWLVISLFLSNATKTSELTFVYKLENFQHTTKEPATPSSYWIIIFWYLFTVITAYGHAF